MTESSSRRTGGEVVEGAIGFQIIRTAALRQSVNAVPRHFFRLPTIPGRCFWDRHQHLAPDYWRIRLGCHGQNVVVCQKKGEKKKKKG